MQRHFCRRSWRLARLYHPASVLALLLELEAPAFEEGRLAEEVCVLELLEQLQLVAWGLWANTTVRMTRTPTAVTTRFAELPVVLVLPRSVPMMTQHCRCRSTGVATVTVSMWRKREDSHWQALLALLARLVLQARLSCAIRGAGHRLRPSPLQLTRPAAPQSAGAQLEAVLLTMAPGLSRKLAVLWSPAFEDVAADTVAVNVLHAEAAVADDVLPVACWSPRHGG